MRIADRELALSMMYMGEVDRGRLLMHLSTAKQQRVREELVLQTRLAITYRQYRTAIENVIRQLGSAGAVPLRNYLRPRGRNGR